MLDYNDEGMKMMTPDSSVAVRPHKVTDQQRFIMSKIAGAYNTVYHQQKPSFMKVRQSFQTVVQNSDDLLTIQVAKPLVILQQPTASYRDFIY